MIAWNWVVWMIRVALSGKGNILWMAIVVVRTGQCTCVQHLDQGERTATFMEREWIGAGPASQAFHALVPSLQCSKTLPPAVCQQVSPAETQFLWVSSFLTVLNAELLHTATWCYWHVTDKCAREKKKLPWSCLESPVLRRALLKPTLLSHIRSFDQYFHFLSLVAFTNSSLFQLSLLPQLVLDIPFSLPCMYFLSISWSLKNSKISSVS